MKENSTEEDIKMIEILKNKNLYINIKPKSSICIDCINKNKNKHIEAEVVINEKLEEAINYTLSAYKRVLKENEEFKKENSMIRKVDKIVENITITDIENAIEEAEQQYIPVQKVKDNLIKYQEEYELLLEHQSGKESNRTKYLRGRIHMCQELLEGRK